MDKTINNALSRGNKDEIIGWGMPSNRSIQNIFQSPIPLTQQEFTAPANGYVRCSCGDAVTLDFWVGNSSSNARVSLGNSTGANYYGFLPIKKGDKAFLKANGASAYVTSCFIYCEGEV